MLGLLILLAIALAVLIVLLSAMLAHQMIWPPRRTTGYALAKGMACDPGDLGLDFEEWTLDRPDGATLPVWEISNPKSKIQNPEFPFTAIFIHGWGHSRIDSLARIKPFLPLFDCIILYDLRGHGDSTGGPSRLGCREDDDLIALIERLGHGRYVLIGHSMGAVIAIAAAAKFPHGVTFTESKIQIADPTRRNPKSEIDIAAIIAYAPYCEFHPSLRGRLHVAGYPARPLSNLALLIHKLRGITPLSISERLAATVPCPLLTIHGCDDSVAPIDHGRRIASCVPNGILHQLDRAGHVDTHLVDTTAHDRVVREFIEGLIVQKRTESAIPA